MARRVASASSQAEASTRTTTTTVERRRRRIALATKQTRRSVTGCNKVTTHHYAVAAVLDKGHRGGWPAGGEAKKGRAQTGGASRRCWESPAEATHMRSSPGLRLEFTPAALVDPLPTLSASNPSTCAAQRPHLPDAPSMPYDGPRCRMVLYRWW